MGQTPKSGGRKIKRGEGGRGRAGGREHRRNGGRKRERRKVTGKKEGGEVRCDSQVISSPSPNCAVVPAAQVPKPRLALCDFTVSDYCT